MKSDKTVRSEIKFVFEFHLKPQNQVLLFRCEETNKFLAKKIFVCWWSTNSFWAIHHNQSCYRQLLLSFSLVTLLCFFFFLFLSQIVNFFSLLFSYFSHIYKFLSILNSPFYYLPTFSLIGELFPALLSYFLKCLLNLVSLFYIYYYFYWSFICLSIPISHSLFSFSPQLCGSALQRTLSKMPLGGGRWRHILVSNFLSSSS